MRLDSLKEGSRLAVEQIRTNRFRSILTILGIVVGVATVMTMSALIQGVRSTILAEFEAAGPKNFMVMRFDLNQVRISTGHSGPPWGNNPRLTVVEARAIGQLPSVRRTVIGFDLNADFEYGRQRLLGVPIKASENGWGQFTNGKLIAGHDMLPSDVAAANRIVIISQPMAETMFGALDPIGRTLRVNGIPFEVIGVFAAGNNIFASLAKNIAIMPYTAAIKHLNAWNGMLSALVVTSAGSSQTQAMDEVITLLRTRRGLGPGEENDFAVVRQDQLVDTFNRFTAAFFVVMLALSSVALMVGGVGVIAIMMIAVTERTREIGIRKAVGATRREILWQFLFEAVTLTVIGSGIGMAIGGAAAFAIAAVTPIPAVVPLPAIVAALTMAAIAGVAFGMWPAWKAAQMDPVVALRFE